MLKVINTCGDCKHWYDIDVAKKCPRLSQAHAQAAGYISAKRSGSKEHLASKLFEGTGIHKEICKSFVGIQ